MPRTLQLPSWCWDDDDDEYGSEGCDDDFQHLTDDEARLRALEARLDRETGADIRNSETFGEGWLGMEWTFEEALEANQRLAADRYAAAIAAGRMPHPADSAALAAAASGETAGGCGGEPYGGSDTKVAELPLCSVAPVDSFKDSMLVSTTSSEDGEEEARRWNAMTAVANHPAVSLDPNVVLQ